jgi:hypothetical protein
MLPQPTLVINGLGPLKRKDALSIFAGRVLVTREVRQPRTETGLSERKKPANTRLHNNGRIAKVTRHMRDERPILSRLNIETMI